MIRFTPAIVLAFATVATAFGGALATAPAYAQDGLGGGGAGFFGPGPSDLGPGAPPQGDEPRSFFRKDGPPPPRQEDPPHKLDFVAPSSEFNLPGPEETIIFPDNPDGDAKGLLLGGNVLTLNARLTDDSPDLTQGLTWRIFGTTPSEDGSLPLIATSSGGTARLTLPDGAYYVHAAFGRAGATQRIELNGVPETEDLVLEAGGLRLSAVVGEDFPLDEGKVTYEIYYETENDKRELVTPNAEAGHIVRLHAGTYSVVSRYGTLNAIVRAEIEVKPGELTEAIIHHAGAEVTLKLVEQEGGEALANTRWTVLTQGGDTIHESVGAFPHIILAEGTYTAVARHDDTTYARDFEIKAGMNRDVEVRLTDLVRPEGMRLAR
ncbi:hypothetical protein [Afifella sp. YEN Y35]|uniref:hypothetical protein n=1 Tax=Afifella sp. YEN Y35 TaxID=3388337 RepID=UPI0039E04334